MKSAAVIVSYILILHMRFLCGTTPPMKTFLTVSVNTKPGAIISVLKTEEEHTKSQILSLSDEDKLCDYVSLSREGILTLKSNVTNLTGKTLPLTIQRQSPTRQWKEEIHLRFEKTPAAVEFNTKYVHHNPPEFTVDSYKVGLKHSELTTNKEILKVNIKLII